MMQQLWTQEDGGLKDSGPSGAAALTEGLAKDGPELGSVSESADTASLLPSSSSSPHAHDDDRSHGTWYVIQVYAGFEQRIADEIQELIQQQKVSGVLDVLVPTQTVIQVQRGVKVPKERSLLPGYVLIQVAGDSQAAWQAIVDIPRVSAFLGGNRAPLPVPNEEAERLVRRGRGSRLPTAVDTAFHVGSVVRICDGPFVDFSGTVEEVDPIRSRLKVSVTIFGRATLVDLEFRQVEEEDRATG